MVTLNRLLKACWILLIGGSLLAHSACANVSGTMPEMTISPTASLISSQSGDGGSGSYALLPTETPAYRLAAPPPGITYQVDGQIYRTTRSPEPELLSGTVGADAGENLSADKQYILMDEPERQVVVSQKDDSRSVIWPQEGLNLCRFTWVWSQSSVLLAVLLPPGSSPDFSCNQGTPVLYHPPSQNLEILGDGRIGIGGIALSPDGRKIAYDVNGLPEIFDFDSGAERIDLADFGLENSQSIQIADPAWSPSGRYLAWTFQESLEPLKQGVVVLDMNKESGDIFAPFSIGGYEAFRPQMIFNATETHLVLRHYQHDTGTFAAQLISISTGMARQLEGFFNQWSPSGEFLLIENSPDDGERCRLEVESIDGSFILPVCRGDQALWSPDDMRLLAFPYNREAFWLIDVSTGQFQQVDLPSGARILKWELAADLK